MEVEKRSERTRTALRSCQSARFGLSAPWSPRELQHTVHSERQNHVWEIDPSALSKCEKGNLSRGKEVIGRRMQDT